MTPEELAEIRGSLSPLLDPPTPDEVTLKQRYQPTVKEYRKIKDRELIYAANVASFLQPSAESLLFLKPADTMSWYSYCKLASDDYISDESLDWLTKYTLHLIPSKHKEKVWVVKVVNTSPLTAASNKQYDKGGIGFRRSERKGRSSDYATYFGKTTKSLHEFRSIFFPFHVDGNHFVGAIVHPSTGTVYTFDSFGTTMGSHDEVFHLLDPFLGHALTYEDAEQIEWTHVRLTVPMQDDGISCGLFRTINGIILAVVDDPTSSEVNDILFDKHEILRTREKIRGFVLACSHVTLQPVELKEHFQDARVKLPQIKAAKKLAEAAGRNKESFDLSQCSDSEDETKEPSNTGGRDGKAALKSSSEITDVSKLIANHMLKEATPTPMQKEDDIKPKAKKDVIKQSAGDDKEKSTKPTAAYKKWITKQMAKQQDDCATKKKPEVSEETKETKVTKKADAADANAAKGGATMKKADSSAKPSAVISGNLNNNKKKNKKQSKISPRQPRSFVQTFAGQDVITPFVNEDSNAKRRKMDYGANIHDNLCYNPSGVLTLKVDIAPIASKSTMGSKDNAKQTIASTDDDVTGTFELSEAAMKRRNEHNLFEQIYGKRAE
eukprot:scaffold2771_cov68-Skeletonema_dohrnii-CCMP3373.AAC.1